MIEQLRIDFGCPRLLNPKRRQRREHRREPNDAFPEDIVALFVDILGALVLQEVILVDSRGDFVDDSLLLFNSKTASIHFNLSGIPL